MAKIKDTSISNNALTRSNTERDPYFDALRGIAIIFVVAIHTYIPPTDYSCEVTWYNITLRELIGCAVPLFFAISGYFMAKQPINTIEEYRCFNANT